MNLLQEVETELGILKVDINSVIAKAISGIALLPHEVDAFIKWVLSETSNAQSILNAATPIISAVGGLATVAATGNPAAAAEVATAISGVNQAWTVAQSAITAMNKASTALAATGGGGSLTSDASAVIAAADSLSNGNAKVAAVSSAALSAAQAIQAIIPPKSA